MLAYQMFTQTAFVPRAAGSPLPDLKNVWRPLSKRFVFAEAKPFEAFYVTVEMYNIGPVLNLPCCLINRNKR